MNDTYIEGSGLNEAPGDQPIELSAGPVNKQIAALQQQLSSMDKNDMGRWKVLDALEGLYGKLPQPDQEEPEQAPEEPLEVKLVGDAVDDAIDKLTRDWGDDLEANVKIAQGAVADLSQSLGGNVGTFLDSANLANDPVVIKVFHALGSGAPVPKITRPEAQRLLDRLRVTPDYLKSSPLHEALVNVVMDLQNIIHG